MRIGESPAFEERFHAVPVAITAKIGPRIRGVERIGEEIDRCGMLMLAERTQHSVAILTRNPNERTRETLADGGRCIHAEQPAVVNQCDAVAAEGLVHVRRGDEDWESR